MRGHVFSNNLGLKYIVRIEAGFIVIHVYLRAFRIVNIFLKNFIRFPFFANNILISDFRFFVNLMRLCCIGLHKTIFQSITLNSEFFSLISSS